MTPNKCILEILYKLFKYLKKSNLQFKALGEQNIWIVKPSLNSKGQGILLVDNLDDALD